MCIRDRVEDPKTAKGIVKREVVRIVTPGTNLDTQALDETKNNYIMCIVYIGEMCIRDSIHTDYVNSSVRLSKEYHPFCY